MSAYLGKLACPRCATEVEERAFMFGCPACAADDVAVNVHPVYEPAVPHREAGQPGLFAWRNALPIAPDTTVVSLGEGNTPVVPLPRFGARAGVPDLVVKDETRNPTWSYKDRLAAVAITKAKADGADTVVVSTTGNHGAAVAAYAAAAGLRCVALTLASVPLTMKVLMQAYGADVVAVEHPPDRWKLMKEAVEAKGWVPMSGLLDPPIGSNPFGIDGYKTVAYELVEQLDRAPDVVVVPVAYADGLTGIHRGFVDLVQAGRIPGLPRLVAAEPLGPYAATLAAGDDRVHRVDPRPSVAFSTAGTVGTFQGVHTLRQSGGVAIEVGDDDRTMEAQLAAGREGLYLEASAATALVAVEDAAAKGFIRPGDLVVAIGTSSGLKDVGTTAERLPDVPVIEATLDALAGHLA